MRRKSKTLLLIIIIFLIFLLQIVDAKKLPLKDIIITVDPGHGGRDPGTMYGKLMEKDLNLEISKKLKTVLENSGATVYLIREKDEDFSSKWDQAKKRGDLYRRILMIQNNKSDLYLSIHLNYYKDAYYSGPEVLYHPINPKNEVLAQSIMDSFKESLNGKREIVTTDLYLYKNTRVPGVLIECGFLSNANERYLLQQESYQEKISNIITSGVITYIKKIKSQ